MHAVYKLIHYAINNNLIQQIDYDYVFNKLIHKLDIEIEHDTYKHIHLDETIYEILDDLLNEAVSKELIQPNTLQMRDLFESEIMDIFTPNPSQVQWEFDNILNQDSQRATTVFYNRSVHSNYIKTARIKKNEFYTVSSKYGNIEITINQSKPEKDPRDIAKIQTEKKYPKCLLCKENVGFYGKSNYPGRSNHRVVKITLNEEPFYLQFSPYVYYKEHIIVFHEIHFPMQIDLKTFERLFDFVDQFPHYFLGSNAGIPIVGGSILNHEHYQGGKATFPIDKAEAFYTITIKNISIELLIWPLSVLRLKCNSREELIEFSENLRHFYQSYSDISSDLISHTGEINHNAINPILRKKNDTYTLLVALRNNRTNHKFKNGIFHPHPQRHNIKKENIGLIEVMGLAILPGRLASEFVRLEEMLKSDYELDLGVHGLWFETLKKKNIKTLEGIKKEAGKVFVEALEDCGVFKQTIDGRKSFKAFLGRFLEWV